jgi:16S rRNA (cytosine1402-N4)-methyltransferase
MTKNIPEHIPVLLEEAITGLLIKKSGTYLDCTFGRGGHSREILKKLGPNGRLISMDKDQAAIESAQKINDKRFEIINLNFSQMGEILKKKNIKKLDGILMDLGVSSPQLDEPSRGFSFQSDAALDMRMDQSQSLTAADIVNSYEEKELIELLFSYGEEKFSKRIVRSILIHRETMGPINRTHELAKIINQAVPKREPGKNPATRTFQALRIKVNEELEEVEKSLPIAFDYLNPKGRLVVISFHSLEDRIVKNFTKIKMKTDLIPKYIPIRASEIKLSSVKKIGKLIMPSKEELKLNPRSRSAKLRIIEKVSD